MTDYLNVQNEEPIGPAARPRRRRPKTIRVKTLLQLVLLILLVAAIIFGIMYYRGRRPLEDIEPVLPNRPPYFLYSLYEGKNRLAHPIFPAVDRNGRLYVSNNDRHTVEVFSPNGKPAAAFGGSGTKPGNMLFPYGIGILSDGHVLVAETGNFRIQEFGPDGKFIRIFVGQSNKIGLVKPGPLYVDSKDRIYVGDVTGSQVLVLDRSGRVLRRIGNIGYPHGIAVDEQNKKIYVGDAGALKIKVFDLANNSDRPAGEIAAWSPGMNFTMIRGLAVDKLGRLYVADTIMSTVRVFDKNGTYLFSFGKQGFEDGEFLYPNGICTDSAGRIYVADWSNNRVQVWGY